MTRSTICAMGLSSLFLGGCNAALWGNVFVVGVTVAVFCGTLFLGESSRGPAAEASASTTGHS